MLSHQSLHVLISQVQVRNVVFSEVYLRNDKEALRELGSERRTFCEKPRGPARFAIISSDILICMGQDFYLSLNLTLCFDMSVRARTEIKAIPGTGFKAEQLALLLR